jgi:hypothetical protein
LSVGDENPLRRERGWRNFELRSRFGSAPKLKLAELRFGFVINLPLHELSALQTRLPAAWSTYYKAEVENTQLFTSYLRLINALHGEFTCPYGSFGTNLCTSDERKPDHRSVVCTASSQEGQLRGRDASFGQCP